MAERSKLYTNHDIDPSECECPIHRGKTTTPEVPKGIDFSDRVTVESIKPHVAEEIYLAHHSYMGKVHQSNIAHHGIMFDGELAGAITYRYPLGNKWDLSQYFDVDEMVVGDKIVEVNRICIGIPMQNLASCGLAASQEQFIQDEASKRGFEYLLTFIRVDHIGTMLKALVTKGWTYCGVSEAKPAGNREKREINESDKYRWLNQLEVSDNQSQSTISDFIPT